MRSDRVAQPVPEIDRRPPEDGVAPTAPPAVAVERGRYEFLDCIRGIAALIVVVQHGAERFGLPLLGPAPVVNLGETGVVAFFLVSGFIIPLSIERHRSLPAFWAGRFFRLYPAYWASLLACFALVLLGRLPEPFPAGMSPLLGFAANATMLQQLLHVPEAVGVYWTLGLELVFYALCSLLHGLKLLRRSESVLWIVLVLFLLLNLGAAARHHSVPAGRLGLLVSAFGGTLFLRLLRGTWSSRRLPRIAAALALVLAVGLFLRFGVFRVPEEVGVPSFAVVLVSWLLGYLLFVLPFLLRRRHVPRPLLWLGRISYSLYLWHILVFYALPSLGSPWLSLLVAVVVSLALAELSFRLIELPGIALHRRLRR